MAKRNFPRPKINDSCIVVAVPSDLKREVFGLAVEQGLTPSVVVRRALTSLIKNAQSESPQQAA